MQLCDDGHDEVCYECRNCPVCRLTEEVERLETQIEVLEDRINELEN